MHNRRSEERIPSVADFGQDVLRFYPAINVIRPSPNIESGGDIVNEILFLAGFVESGVTIVVQSVDNQL